MIAALRLAAADLAAHRLAATGLAALLALALPGAAPGHAGGFEPAARRSCTGHDLRPVLAAQSPAVAADIAARAAALPFGTGRLFRLRKAGVPDSTLFGMMSGHDERVAVLPPVAARAFEASRMLLLDFDIPEGIAGLSDDRLDTVLAALTARPEERASALLTPADFAVLEAAIVRQGVPASWAGTMKPSFLVYITSGPTCGVSSLRAPRPLLSDQLGNLARQAKRPVASLQTLEQQIAALKSIPSAYQRPMAEHIVQVAGLENDIFETAIRAYLDGQIGWLMTWTKSRAGLPGRDVPATPPLLAELFAARTREMRDRALPHLAEGGVFFAVEAFAIPGRSGFARLLEEAGYTVEPVEETSGAPSAPAPKTPAGATKKVSAR